VGPQAIARELETYNKFLASGLDAPTKLSVISGRASLMAFLSSRLGETKPLIVHFLGIYGDMVTWSNFRGQFFGLTGDSYLDSPPPILWQRDPHLMISDRNVRAPPHSGHRALLQHAWCRSVYATQSRMAPRGGSL
jgi:hypothetical protein